MQIQDMSTQLQETIGALALLLLQSKHKTAPNDELPRNAPESSRMATNGPTNPAAGQDLEQVRFRILTVGAMSMPP